MRNILTLIVAVLMASATVTASTSSSAIDDINEINQVDGRKLATKFPTRSTKSPTSGPTVPTPSPTEPTSSPTFKDGIDTTRYNIEVVFVGEVDEEVKKSVLKAKAKWESIVKSDIPNTFTLKKGKQCFIPKFQLSEDKIVDDLLVFVETENYDGVGGEKSRSGTCYVSNSPRLYARVGAIGFDAADVAEMVKSNTLDIASTHQMGHLLGLGYFWQSYKLVPKRTNPKYKASYSGKGGIEGLQQIGGSGKPIVTKLAGKKSPYGHWDIDTYPDEIMSYTTNPDFKVSKLSVLALKDLGFEVDETKADPYTITPGLRGVNVGDNDINASKDYLDHGVMEGEVAVGEVNPY